MVRVTEMTLMTGCCVLCNRWHGRHAYKSSPGPLTNDVPSNVFWRTIDWFFVTWTKNSQHLKCFELSEGCKLGLTPCYVPCHNIMWSLAVTIFIMGAWWPGSRVQCGGGQCHHHPASWGPLSQNKQKMLLKTFIKPFFNVSVSHIADFEPWA